MCLIRAGIIFPPISFVGVNMPDVRSFLSGFGLKGRGQKIGRLVIDDVRCKHVLKVQYREYEYPLNIRFKSNGEINLTSDEVKEVFEEFLRSGNRVIYSGYGNPYVCNVGKVSVKDLSDGMFELNSTGICVRSFEIAKKRKV